MEDYELIKINEAFEKYRQDIFALQNDIQWWRSFLTISIDDFIKNNSNNKVLYESIFTVYDINPNSNSGYLKDHELSFSYSTNELHDKKNNFFNWIINLAVVKAYNSVEILLLESINIKYFPEKKINFNNKKAPGQINSEIKKYLQDNSFTINSSNNQHIIDFIKGNSQNFLRFTEQITRDESKTTWDNFFIMFSILRNVITHNGMIISQDTKNQIQSLAGDFFKSYFKLSPIATLIPIQDQFINFLVFVNDFTINTVKFIFEEKNLEFLKLYN